MGGAAVLGGQHDIARGRSPGGAGGLAAAADALQQGLGLQNGPTPQAGGLWVEFCFCGVLCDLPLCWCYPAAIASPVTCLCPASRVSQGKTKVHGTSWAGCPLTCWLSVEIKQSDQWQIFLLTAPQLGAALISSPVSSVTPPVCFFSLPFGKEDKRTKKNKGKHFHGIQNLWSNHASPSSNVANLIFAEGCPSEKPAAFLIDEESPPFCSKCLSFPFLKST